MNTRKFPWSPTTFIRGDGFVLLRGAHVTDAWFDPEWTQSVPGAECGNARQAVEPDAARARRITLRSLLPSRSLEGYFEPAEGLPAGHWYWE